MSKYIDIYIYVYLPISTYICFFLPSFLYKTIIERKGGKGLRENMILLANMSSKNHQSSIHQLFQDLMAKPCPFYSLFYLHHEVGHKQLKNNHCFTEIYTSLFRSQVWSITDAKVRFKTVGLSILLSHKGVRQNDLPCPLESQKLQLVASSFLIHLRPPALGKGAKMEVLCFHLK